MSKPNKEYANKYAILPYLVAMLITVIAILLLSYFAQQRNNNTRTNQFSQGSTYKTETMSSWIDAPESRIKK